MFLHGWIIPFIIVLFFPFLLYWFWRCSKIFLIWLILYFNIWFNCMSFELKKILRIFADPSCLFGWFLYPHLAVVSLFLLLIIIYCVELSYFSKIVHFYLLLFEVFRFQENDHYDAPPRLFFSVCVINFEKLETWLFVHYNTEGVARLLNDAPNNIIHFI